MKHRRAATSAVLPLDLNEMIKLFLFSSALPSMKKSECVRVQQQQVKVAVLSS